MKQGFVSAVLLLCASLALAAPPSNKIFITSTSKTDQRVQPNQASSEAAAIARQMEVFTAIALSDQYPCSNSMTSEDVHNLLNWERQRDLLGNPSPDALASIATSLGANVLVSYQVTQLGDRVTVTGSVINAATGRTLEHKTTTLPGGYETVDAMEAFAKDLAASMGQVGPKCNGGWKGTVTVESSGGGSAATPGRNDTLQGTSSLHLDCKVQASVGNCTVTFGSSMATKESNYSAKASGKVETPVTVNLVGGKVTINIAMVTVHGTKSLMLGGMDASSEDDFQFGGWSAEGTARAGSSSLTGAWSDGAGTTISWSLSM